jgi:hypothetical protein
MQPQKSCEYKIPVDDACSFLEFLALTKLFLKYRTVEKVPRRLEGIGDYLKSRREYAIFLS